MIVHCPKCSYSRKPTDTAPATECPACGVIFEKILNLSNASTLARPTPTPKPSAAVSPSLEKAPLKPPATTTSCPACGGLVAYGAKTCPHCGKAEPAPKPSDQVRKKHLLIAVGVIVLIIMGLSKSPSSSGAKSAANADLDTYGQKIAQSALPGALAFRASNKTTDSPLAYKLVFASSSPDLMSDPAGSSSPSAHLRNQGIALMWKEKFCTSDLSSIISRHRLALVSGQIVDTHGEIQAIAICNY